MSPPTVLDPTDVPPVCPSALRLALALEFAAHEAPGSVASLGAALSDAALARIETALWRGGPPCAIRTSVMLRLAALAQTLRGRRFAALASADPRAVNAAIDAAAKLRLNVGAGLNPMRLMAAVTDRASTVTALPTRAPAQDEALPLAA